MQTRIEFIVKSDKLITNAYLLLAYFKLLLLLASFNDRHY